MSSVEWIDEFNECQKDYDIYRTIIITKNQKPIYESLLKHEYSVLYGNPNFEDFVMLRGVLGLNELGNIVDPSIYS